MNSTAMTFFAPSWPLPENVRCVISTRDQAPVGPASDVYLADVAGVVSAEVSAARAQLAQQLKLTRPPQWLQQEHGTTVIEAGDRGPVPADASFTRSRGLACAVLTADCLPVLISACDGSEVAAAHAGWKGLAAGIVTRTVRALVTPPKMLSVFLGPAICARHFEVGSEVREAFLHGRVAAIDRARVAACFQPSRRGKGFYMADLYRLARLELKQLGVDAIYGGEFCTVEQNDRFYSHRRSGDKQRMASLIWIVNRP